MVTVNLPTLNLQLLFVLLLLHVLVRQGNTQDLEKISATRPDRSQGTSTVPKYTLQLETGFNYQKDDLKGNEVRVHAYPSLMLRLGLLQRIELRVEGSIQDSVIEGSTRRKVRGLGPLGVGGRIYLWQQEGVLPEAALTAMVTLPIGSTGLHPQNPESRMNLGLSNELSDMFSLTYSFRYGWVQEGTEIQFASNLLAELNKKLSVYIEYFGLKEQESRTENSADGGILWFPRPNVQLDIAAGAGLNNAAPDYFITLGVSVRLPH